VLPQVMPAYCSTPHTSNGETPNLQMLGREMRVPDHFTYLVPEQDYPVHEYASKLVEQMKVAREILREKQWQVRKKDSEEPPSTKLETGCGRLTTVGVRDRRLSYSLSL